VNKITGGKSKLKTRVSADKCRYFDTRVSGVFLCFNNYDRLRFTVHYFMAVAFGTRSAVTGAYDKDKDLTFPLRTDRHGKSGLRSDCFTAGTSAGATEESRFVPYAAGCE
jgi:hypothetical protein